MRTGIGRCRCGAYKGETASPVRTTHSKWFTSARRLPLPSSGLATIPACRSGLASKKHADARLCYTQSAAQGQALTSALPVITSPRQDRINSLKLRLLSLLASLDRGLAANGRDARGVDELVRQLEAVGGPVTLAWGPPAPEGGPSSLDLLQGNWRLLYTSGFTTGSLGGRQPGPPAALVPSTLGQVYQNIDGSKMRLDNIVEFILALPSLSNVLGSFPLMNGEGAPMDYTDAPSVRLTLKHDYEIKGLNTVEIVFEETSVELLGTQLFAQLPKLDVPQLPDALKPPKNIRSATFQVVYLDDQMRITRGDRQELRIYMKEGAGKAAWSLEE